MTHCYSNQEHFNDKTDLLAIFDREQRIELNIPGLIQENTGRVIRHRSPREHDGFIAYQRPG